MNIEKMVSIMKVKNIHIPLYLVQNMKLLNINEKDLLFLGVLINCDTLIDYDKISSVLNVPKQDVLLEITNLCDKGLTEIKVVKNKNGIMEEHLYIDNLYNKIALNMIGEEDKKESNIYETFEQEFGRTLSSMEYEIISSWLESNYQEEVIIEALKEAVYNGANNLRYIDRILYEWNKKGIKNVSQVRKEKEHFIKSKNKDIEIPDYNWLDDNE
jgi:DNA replication protein